MVALSAATAVSAYQREASRLVAAAPQVGGKRITRDAAVSFGPLTIRYSATDYEFDLSGASAQTSFPDALDAAAATVQLAESASQDAGAAATPNALTRRQALAGYRAAASPATPSRSMFSAMA